MRCGNQRILDFATTNESGQIMFGFHAWSQKAWLPRDTTEEAQFLARM